MYAVNYVYYAVCWGCNLKRYQTFKKSLQNVISKVLVKYWGELMYTKIHFVLNRFDISPNVTALKIINIANSSVLLHNEALHVILVMHY